MPLSGNFNNVPTACWHIVPLIAFQRDRWKSKHYCSLCKDVYGHGSEHMLWVPLEIYSRDPMGRKDIDSPLDFQIMEGLPYIREPSNKLCVWWG
ncbi:hypothetical protein CEXT_294041 [Caerostris extrusa]|uniref:Uncharacterized protein n=1 Tax=Caerostris extrusa TaxID=172846 RepID=A0AAV4XUL0_CAEEX|nr:hypothetical protein CEXT_294041 [Caerostris extrusa]